MGAGHDHAAPTSGGARHTRALLGAFVVLSVFMVAEVIGALVTGSLALLSDAGHMLTDVIGIGMALAAIQLATRSRRHAHRTFGLHRAEILAALANSVLLMGVAGWVMFEAVGRISHPPDISAGPMLAVAVAGLAANIFAAGLLLRGSRESLNVEGAFLEVIADTVSSVGVIVSGVVLLLTGWNWVDPLVGIAIGVWIVPRALRLAARSLRILVQAADPATDLAAIRRELCSDSEVLEVHDLHVWTLTSQMEVATAHLVVTTGADCHGVLDRAHALLAERHGIEHATIQIEPEQHLECETLSW